MISVRHGAVSSQIPKNPAFNRAILGSAYIRSSNTLGEVAHSSKTGVFCKREYNAGHALTMKSTHVRLPVEPKYELTIEDATEDTDNGRQIRKIQLKIKWEMNCQKKRRQAFCVVNDHGLYATINVFRSCISVMERKEDVF